MKKSRFTGSQISEALKRVEAGPSTHNQTRHQCGILRRRHFRATSKDAPKVQPIFSKMSVGSLLHFDVDAVC
jgi:hypothetical protein